MFGLLESFFGHYFLNVMNTFLLYKKQNELCSFSGRAQPYHQLRDELRRRSRVKYFFLELSQVIVDGEVLRYIDYRSEIPRPM